MRQVFNGVLLTIPDLIYSPDNSVCGVFTFRLYFSGEEITAIAVT